MSWKVLKKISPNGGGDDGKTRLMQSFYYVTSQDRLARRIDSQWRANANARSQRRTFWLKWSKRHLAVAFCLSNVAYRVLLIDLDLHLWGKLR
jgi:hypothetical protein